MLPVKEHLKHPSPRSNFICPFNVKTFINLKHLYLRESQRSLQLGFHYNEQFNYNNQNGPFCWLLTYTTLAKESNGDLSLTA